MKLKLKNLHSKVFFFFLTSESCDFLHYSNISTPNFANTYAGFTLIWLNWHVKVDRLHQVQELAYNLKGTYLGFLLLFLPLVL